MNLLHLVSEQTMQNLLPLLALRPRLVIQVRSSDPRFKAAADHLKLAVQTLRRTSAYSNLQPEFVDWVIDETSPDVDRSRRKVGEALALWPGSVVNLTGGTKQMSIGAFLAADYQQEPVLYCDTQLRRFASLNQKRALPDLPGFDIIAATLTVESVLAAHGIRPDHLQSRQPSTEELEAARQLGELRRQDSAAMANYARRLREQLLPQGRKIRREAIDRTLQAGLPGPNTETDHRFLQAAVRAGWATEKDGVWTYRLRGNTLRPEDRLRAALELNQALVGGWFELEVYDRMKASGRFVDLRTEVQARDRSHQSLGETDVVGIDRQWLTLVFVSCKLSDEFLDKPLEHVFATRHRSLEFGGAFAQTLFCINESRDPNKRRIVQDACRATRAQLLEGEPDFTKAK